jgi:hypothetical protein
VERPLFKFGLRFFQHVPFDPRKIGSQERRVIEHLRLARTAAGASQLSRSERLDDHDASGLQGVEAHRGTIDRIDGEALLGEPDRVAPLPLPQGKYAATGPDDSRLAFEPSVWLRAVCEAFAGVPLVPEWDTGVFPARVAHGAIQPHLRKIAATSFD